MAALTPKAEIEGDMGDNKVGLQARLMSQALRKLTDVYKRQAPNKLESSCEPEPRTWHGSTSSPSAWAHRLRA